MSTSRPPSKPLGHAATPYRGLNMRLDMARDRVLLIVAALALMTPVFVIYWPASNGLDVVGFPIGRDFINVWSGPQVAFGDKVATLFDIRGYHEAIKALF